MLNVKDIEKYFIEIDLRLKERDKTGDIVLAGGAVMALVYGARDTTKDIDALFKPSLEMRKIISDIALKYNLPEDWLNDGVKGFFTSDMNKMLYKKYDNLTVYTLDAEAMLALKLSSARPESKDQDDSIYLMNVLKIKEIDELYNLVDKYIPNNRKTVGSHFFIQDTFDKYYKKYILKK